MDIIGPSDYASLLARVLLGGFYVLARFRFFYDPSKPEGMRWFCECRRMSLVAKVARCGCKERPVLWAWVAASVEVLAGLGVLFGCFTMLSALGLLAVTLVATRCTAREKVLEQRPVDKLDCACAYLWRVEGLYIGLAIIVLLLGPGKLSIDYQFLEYVIWR